MKLVPRVHRRRPAQPNSAGRGPVIHLQHVLLAVVLLFAGACQDRKKESGPAQPPVSPVAPAVRQEAAMPAPAPAMVATPPAPPAPANVQPAPTPPPLPPPPKLAAFLSALEATGGKPFAPGPLLEKHLGTLAEDHKDVFGDLPDAMIATVLRVGTNPLEAAIVMLVPPDYKICQNLPAPVTFTVFEAEPGEKVPLMASKLDRTLRPDMKPRVELAPAFGDTRAFLIHYQIDEEAESCDQEPERKGRVPDSMALLYKVGQYKFVLYRTFEMSSHLGSWGVTDETTTKLSWHTSTRPGVHYLGVVTEKVERKVNTGSDLDHEFKQSTTNVGVIAMEKGRTWQWIARKALQKLVPSEPALSKLPQDESSARSRP